MISKIHTNATLDPSAQTSQEAAFEAAVQRDLACIRSHVFASDPELSVITVELPSQATMTGADPDKVRRATALRIQSYNLDWFVNFSSDNRSITLQQRQPSDPPVHSGGFSITEVRNSALTSAEPAISAAVDHVHEYFRINGRGPEAFEVPFDTQVPFYALQQAARRIQYYSCDWKIVANPDKHTISGTRIQLV